MEHDEQYWLDRAEEARLQAEQMTNADTKREMLKLRAHSCDATSPE